MNTPLTEHKSEQQFNIDWKEKVVEDYYAEYYPNSRVEKVIFKYLDDLYYVSDDDVFFTIYRKDDGWFMKIDDIAKELEKLFGLSLPDEIKIGDEYIQPARNPIPNRVIKNWTKYSQEKDKEREPLKEHANPKLLNRFLKDFWPDHRSQLYSNLYNTYHPSAYVESFIRPSGNFEEALETITDAIHEGTKLGLLDSNIHYTDLYHYDYVDDLSTADTSEKEREEAKMFVDDAGLPTLNDQLEIIDNTNLDWIHAILLFDVYEDIVDEFKHYCGVDGIDPDGVGKCMDEFPPRLYNAVDTVGTLKQDYYTLYNFMRDLERAGVPVTEYMRSPIFPNIIKLVDTGTTDYNDAGSERTSADWDNTRTQTEFEMDAPDRSEMYEQEEEPPIGPEETEIEIERLEYEIELDKENVKKSEDELAQLDVPTPAEKERDKEEKKKDVIGIGKDAAAFQKGKYFAFGKPKEKGDIAMNMMYEQEPLDEEKETTKTKTPEWKPDFTTNPETEKKEKEIKQTSIDLQKAAIKRKEERLKNLKAKAKTSIGTDSTKAMGADDSKAQPMGGGTESGDDIFDLVNIIEPKTEVTEHEDLEDDYENEDYIDNTPFTRTEALILKTLHRDLSQEELRGISEETPAQWSPVDKKFWGIMKLFGMDYSSGGPEDNVMVSRYAKWAYDNWTEEGDYANIEKPIKAPLKWYDIEVDETGSQIEYKSGEAEVMGWDEDDAEDRAMDDFYSWGGEMETRDWGDYESYETDVTSLNFSRMAEQMDPAIKYNIDQQYRTNPELRDEILQSLEDEEDEGGYDLNPEVGSPTLDVPPRKIAQKFSDVNGYGKIKFDMQGGKGIAYFTDKNLVIKLTGDKSEYETANKLIGIDNEYIVKVIESAKIKTTHSNLPIFVIVEEALPMTEEMEEKWLQCCCGQDSPIYIDYLTQPTLILPPVANQDICLPIYDNIIEIQKNFAEYGIIWNDIGIDNLGIKNGKLAVVDLGETLGGTSEGKTITLENVKIRPLTKKQIKKQLILI